MTSTPKQLAEWTNSAQKVWDSQGRTHWVNMDQFDNYVAGYLRARTELLDQPEGEPPQNKEKLDELLGQYWDIAHSEGSTGVSRGDEAGAVLSAIKSLLDQPEGEPVAWLVPTEIDVELGLMFPFTQIPSDTHPDVKAMLEAFPVYTHPPAPRTTTKDLHDALHQLQQEKQELEAQLAALTQVIVERDLIIGQYIAEVQPPRAGEEA